MSSKAPEQVAPGLKKLEGQYINDQGRVEKWTAYYDEYGRLKARTDYNAGNKKQRIPDVHHHMYDYGPGYNKRETAKHVPGPFSED